MINSRDIKKNLFKKENIFFFIVIFFIFFLDRYSKNIILNNFSENAFYINDFLNFDLIWNTGIGFGLLSNNSTLTYSLITVLIGLVILILMYFSFSSDKIDKFIFSIIIGGAIGNFYDRLSLQAVPDFIDLHFKNFHWFTFNVADIFITIGIIAFILRNISIKNNNG